MPLQQFTRPARGNRTPVMMTGSLEERKAESAARQAAVPTKEAIAARKEVRPEPKPQRRKRLYQASVVSMAKGMV